MAREDESLDEVPGRLTHVIYNTALGHVRVRAEDGPATTVEVPPGEVRFRRVLGAAEPEVALWLGSGERDYLGRMLEHVLRALRITPEARVALEAVQAKLEGLGPPPVVADDGESADAAASVPIVEEPPPAPPPAEATVAPESAAMPPEPARARSERGGERGRGRAAPRPTPAEPPLDDVAAPQPPTRAPAGADANGAEPAAPPAAPLPADSTEGALLAPGADAELLAASQAAFDAAVGRQRRPGRHVRAGLAGPDGAAGARTGSPDPRGSGQQRDSRGHRGRGLAVHAAARSPPLDRAPLARSGLERARPTRPARLARAAGRHELRRRDAARPPALRRILGAATHALLSRQHAAPSRHGPPPGRDLTPRPSDALHGVLAARADPPLRTHHEVRARPARRTRALRQLADSALARLVLYCARREQRAEPRR